MMPFTARLRFILVGFSQNAISRNFLIVILWRGGRAPPVAKRLVLRGRSPCGRMGLQIPFVFVLNGHKKFFELRSVNPVLLLNRRIGQAKKRGKGGSTKTDKVHRWDCGKTRMRKKARADYARAEKAKKWFALVAVIAGKDAQIIEQGHDRRDHGRDICETGSIEHSADRSRFLLLHYAYTHQLLLGPAACIPFHWKRHHLKGGDDRIDRNAREGEPGPSEKGAKQDQEDGCIRRD